MLNRFKRQLSRERSHRACLSVISFSFEEKSVTIKFHWTHNIPIINGTEVIKVTEKPESLDVAEVRMYSNGCYLTLGAYNFDDAIGKSGQVVLKNSVCTQTLTVTVAEE